MEIISKIRWLRWLDQPQHRLPLCQRYATGLSQFTWRDGDMLEEFRA